MRHPRALQQLIDKLSFLPGVGPKTAERYAFYLLKRSEEDLESLAKSIQVLKSQTVRCSQCLSIADNNPCSICSDSNRSPKLLCLVEDSRDLAAIEATGQYHGRYFVLSGLINTIKEVKPDDLPIATLVKNIKENGVEELVIALNFTLEGETTSLYLTRLLKGQLKITRLAKGLPAGSDLEYADELTLASALKNRSDIGK